MTDIDKIKDILIRYNKRKSTPKEESIVENWFLTWENERETLEEHTLNQIKQDIWEKLPTQKATPSINFKFQLAAAALVLIITGIAISQFTLEEKSKLKSTKTKPENFHPEKNKALLTLANGTVISLTDATVRDINNQSGTHVHKLAEGEITYSTTTRANTNNLEYNIINTPKGGQYKIQLSDGTNVWLNSASSLKFPVSFQSSKERIVELEGEGYFEVAKVKNKSFKVSTRQQVVEVLGTQFNVNSYRNEPFIKTTLLEGTIRVAIKDQKDRDVQIVLKPGEQSIVGTNIKVVPADLESTTAWKTGNFIFKNQELSFTMRQIERWYDVDIIYDPDAPKMLKIGGSVDKNQPISEILSAMENTGKVKFKIEGRRITVSKR